LAESLQACSRKRRIVETLFLKAAKFEVFDDSVRLSNQRLQNALNVGHRVIDREGCFAAVGRDKIRGLVCIFAVGIRQKGQAPAADIIASLSDAMTSSGSFHTHAFLADLVGTFASDADAATMPLH